jgi:hypothetical protein
MEIAVEIFIIQEIRKTIKMPGFSFKYDFTLAVAGFTYPTKIISELPTLR